MNVIIKEIKIDTNNNNKWYTVSCFFAMEIV